MVGYLSMVNFYFFVVSVFVGCSLLAAFVCLGIFIDGLSESGLTVLFTVISGVGSALGAGIAAYAVNSWRKQLAVGAQLNIILDMANRMSILLARSSAASVSLCLEVSMLYQEVKCRGGLIVNRDGYAEKILIDDDVTLLCKDRDVADKINGILRRIDKSTAKGLEIYEELEQAVGNIEAIHPVLSMKSQKLSGKVIDGFGCMKDMHWLMYNSSHALQKELVDYGSVNLAEVAEKETFSDENNINLVSAINDMASSVNELRVGVLQNGI